MTTKIAFYGIALLLLALAAPAKGQSKAGARDDGDPRRKYSIEQAVSERAQLHTIAFDGLAFLTGDLCCDTFLPPGKVSDYFGFQYMRDIDVNERGHNTDFLTRIAHHVLRILTTEQKAQLIALGKEQAPQIRELALKRFPLIKAFCRNLAGETPAGNAALDRDSVMKYSGAMWELDGELAYRRAEVVGKIVHSFTAEQKAEFAKLKFGDYRSWPQAPEPTEKRSMPHDVHVAVMTYASELFSWYAGSVDADTYFCPERHGTYFGSFYLKDAPAMGKRDYSISTALTGDSGEQFLATLTPPQRERITGIVKLQRADLREIVDIRRAISTELRRFMNGETPDKVKVLALSRRYGELDGGLSWLYATRFAEVNKTVTASQRQQLQKLRNLDGYACKGAYVYSQPVTSPDFPNTDFLFATTAK